MTPEKQTDGGVGWAGNRRSGDEIGTAQEEEADITVVSQPLQLLLAALSFVEDWEDWETEKSWRLPAQYVCLRILILIREAKAPLTIMGKGN